MNAELSILLGKQKTVLEIRDFLSGEFEPVPLDTCWRCSRRVKRAAR